MSKFSLTQKQGRFFVMLMLLSMSISQVLCDKTFFDIAQSAADNVTSSTGEVIKAFFWPALLIGVVLFVVVPKNAKPIFGAFIVGVIFARIFVGLQSPTEGTADEMTEWFGGESTTTSRSIFGLQVASFVNYWH